MFVPRLRPLGRSPLIAVVAQACGCIRSGRRDRGSNAGYVQGRRWVDSGGIRTRSARRQPLRHAAILASRSSSGAAIATTAFDPLQVTLISVALTVVASARRLPFLVP
jgi:hypothetical protein